MNLYKQLRKIKDTTGPLWDMLYKVSVPYLLSRTEQELETYGTVLSGNQYIDADVSKDMMITMKSISELAEYYREGIPIGLINKDDAEPIYNAIQDHLLAWKTQLNVGINIGDAPVEDLVLLDEFANSVFDVAKHQYKPGYDDNFLVRQLGYNNKIGPHNFFKPEVIKTISTDIRINPSDTSTKDTTPKRDSLSDFFKAKVITLRH